MLMRLLLLCSWLLLGLLTTPAAAETAAPAPLAPATLKLAGHSIATLRSAFGTLNPEQRVARAEERIRALTPEDLSHPVQVTPFARDGVSGLRFYINNKPLFALIEGDLDPSEGQTLLGTADQANRQLNQLRQAFLEQDSPEKLAWAIGLSLGATALLVLAMLAIGRARARAQRRLLQRPVRPGRWLARRPELNGILQSLEKYLIDLSVLLAALLALHLWLSFVLTRFPYTRPWGLKLTESLLQLLSGIADSVLESIPGLAKIAVILVLTRLAIRMLGWIFDAVEQGRLALPGLYSETVGATRRLTSIALWLFALTVAYPYLPGSNSDAFKGVSVFFGLMVTLGSTGIMNHAMSGLVLVYSRALKPGDLVQVGDTDGIVTELGALSTKIRTRHGNEVTLPNSVVVGGKVTNYTRQAGQLGLPLSTKLTIGYDTPWRQVHAMLELAARRTAALNPEVAPIVRQLALQDFYIEYELEVRMVPGSTALPPMVKTALHSQILDVFNEFGVQIMSPNFESQPEGAVLVAKENWYAAPASRDAAG